MSNNVQDALSYNLKPSQVLEAMQVADFVRDSLMIWGPPGIGKSAIAQQYAKTNYPIKSENQGRLALMKQRAEDPEDTLVSMADYVNFENSLLDQETNFIDFRLSQIEPSDLRGIPIPVKVYYNKERTKQILESELHLHESYITETSVVWAAPSILKLPKDWKGVILFDEINSAMPIVQAASYQLILDRRVGELVLPDGALILAAGNRETDGGVTFSLATPLRDRMTHVEMVADYNDWLENFAIPNRLNPATISFIKETGMKHFNTLSTKDTSHAGGASPRSWTRVSEIETARKRLGTSMAVYKSLIAGRVGTAAAIDYVTYIDKMADLPSIDSILDGTTTDFGENKKDVSKNYFIALSLVQRIIEMYNAKIAGVLPVSEWSVICTNFINFMEMNFREHQRELIVYSIRGITDADVNITYAEVPAFRKLVQDYGKLLRDARTIK